MPGQNLTYRVRLHTHGRRLPRQTAKARRAHPASQNTRRLPCGGRFSKYPSPTQTSSRTSDKTQSPRPSHTRTGCSACARRCAMRVPQRQRQAPPHPCNPPQRRQAPPHPHDPTQRRQAPQRHTPLQLPRWPPARPLFGRQRPTPLRRPRETPPVLSGAASDPFS